MKKRKKKNAITLLALVITIVIMLLLAGVAIQMTMGENGLISKSVQAQKEQAKAELYDTAKLSYMSLNAKALENGQPSPQAELALSTTEFRDRYDIVGDDITDKKGTVIDTKENVLNVISGLKGSSEDTEISMKGEYVEKPWPKKVAGVTIPEEDKDKMILKVKVPGNIGTLIFRGRAITIDYGNYEGVEELNLYLHKRLNYNRGEYILKISDFTGFSIETKLEENTEIEVLQWGKPDYERMDRDSNIIINRVSKIYEPEPDNIPISYEKANLTEIPEWLFSKKITSKKMSRFVDCKKITNIPENLFKNCVNAEEFENTFKECTGITNIPENLFKYNTKVKKMNGIFYQCTGITSIPENIFKYNTELTDLDSVFIYCNNITNIPENIFKHNIEVRDFDAMFYGCSKVTSIPENLFKYNTKVIGIGGMFCNCIGITSIPENLFKYNTKVIGMGSMFYNCTGITSIPENLFKYNTETIAMVEQFCNCTGITSIPENLFKYNTKVDRFSSIFEGCTGLTSIPEDLFKYNTIVSGVSESFLGCSNIRYIPDKIIETGKKAMERAGTYNRMFKGCTLASNYSSIPGYLK